MLRNSPPIDQEEEQPDGPFSRDFSRIPTLDTPEPLISERTPLVRSPPRQEPQREYGSAEDPHSDVERGAGLKQRLHGVQKHFSFPKPLVNRHAFNPKTWNRQSIWKQCVVHPASFLPAVLLGLLLNILDALSYGMILFPLGEPVFADLGSDGISMFYVSTIIAQLVYSSGGSIFKGGVGSEMIEVVPFFHKMALMILERVGEDNPKSVLATTILAYAVSSVLTGTVFFIMGAAKLGSLIGFFPRHILIGCIGGVGWFLVATGVEVSARLSGNLEYNLVTLQKLFQLDTVFLWTVPLSLAILFLVVKRFVKSNYLVGGYFLAIGLVFYFFKLVLGIPLETLRDKDWVFDAPRSSEPWYHFYSLYGEWQLSPGRSLRLF
jgi:SulP family sulfate permease